MKKYFFIFTILFLFFVSSLVFAKQIDINVSNTNIYKTTLNIKSDEEIHKIKIYKKIGDKFILFYKSEKNTGSNERNIDIPYSTLSTEHETLFKVILNENEENVSVKDVTVNKVSPKVSMNPSETAKPTTTGSAIPTKPSLSPSSSSTSSNPSETTNPSSSPSFSPSNPDELGENENIKINVNVLMLDNVYYNFADLYATINTNLAYTDENIYWKIEDTNVAVFSKDSKYYSSLRGKNVKVRGNGFGDTKITASLPNGDTATCNIKVIISSKEKAPEGDIAAPVAKYDNVVYHRSDRPYYIRKESISWGNDYVESYINNAAKLIRTYPDYDRFKGEAAAKTIYTYKQNDNFKINFDDEKKKKKSVKAGHIHKQTDRMKCGKFDEIVFEKEAGEMSPNGYLFFFTCKNQWEYLLVLEKPTEKWDERTNRWKVLDAKMSSAGVNRDHFHTYCTQMYLEADQARLSMRYTGSGKKGDNSCGHLLHYDFLTGKPQYIGKPSSHGCIHLGVYTDKIYYDTFRKAGLGTRMIMF